MLEEGAEGHTIVVPSNSANNTAQDTNLEKADENTGIVTDSEHDDDDERTIWFREEEKWELTWPIWHMLPREERRSLARQHGYKTIGEFEEYMILQQAVGDSSQPYNNELMYGDRDSQQQTSASTEMLQDPVARSSNLQDNDDDDSVEDGGLCSVEIDSDERNTDGQLSMDVVIENGGKILILSDDLLHRIFDWLFVDTYAQLALVSPHWKSFTRTEATYKRLCERLYLNQSKKRVLHVSRFNNSYRTMLEKRPRVRAGGGVYVMKYARIRKIQRDMWTEIPAGAVLEMVYYRYLYFEENGRVLYALTPVPPHEMFPRLRRVWLTGQSDTSAVWGTYTVQKTCVTVYAKQAWHYVQITLSIDLESRMYGRYGCLSFDHHMTSVSGNFNDDWTSDRIVYDTPDEPFRFIKDKRL
jgi:F-box protein 9